MLVVAASAALVLLIGIVGGLAPSSWLETRLWRVVLGFLSVVPVLGDPLKEDFQLLKEFDPLLAGAVIGALAGGIGAWPLGPRIHNRFFARFNDELFAPIRKPSPFDPLRGALLIDGRLTPLPMAWVAPRHDDSRHAVWTGLRHFARAEPGQPRFGWSLLLGRPGGGKSRLAVEFVRRELARREGTLALPRTRRAALGSWWRLQVLRRPPGEHDPWDAGLIEPGVAGEAVSSYPGWNGRLAINEAWLERLRAWRPRRPTILLLDDPRPGEARLIVDELASMSLRHPVRLLIVNQSEPADLNLRRGGRQAEGGQVRPPLGGPLVLADDSSWRDADLRVALLGLSRSRAQGGGPLVLTSSQIAHVLEITQGNPLLVELAFMATLHGRPVESLTTDSLLTDRVERIEVAIRDAGFDAEFISLLALATLAGGSEGLPKHRLTELRGSREERAGDLSRLFPSDAGDLRNVMPPVRPELIGDVFVEHIVGNDTYSDAWRRRFVADAWALGPAGTLRATLRLGKRDSVLGRLLALGPPDDAGLEPFLVAAAFVEAACIVRADLFARQAFGGLQSAAEARIRGLSPCEALALIAQTLDLPARLQAGEVLLGVSWARLQCVLLDRALTATIADDIKTLVGLVPKLFEVWIRQLGSNPIGMEELLPAADDEPGPALPPRDLARIVEAAFNADARTRQKLLAGRLAVRLGLRAGELIAETGERVRRVTTLGKLAVLRRADRENAEEFAEIVERAGEAGQADAEGALARARAWRAAAWGANENREACRHHTARVDEIAAPWPNDRDLQLERARAWCSMAFVTKENSETCQGCAERVDEIAAFWPNDRDLQNERAQAWRFVTFASTGDPALCRRWAERVDEIARPWPTDCDLQNERAQAWRSMVFATLHDCEACRRHADVVQEIVAPWTKDRDFQLERAFVSRLLTFATRSDRTTCRQHAEMLEEIAAPWPEDRFFQHERAQVWRYMAEAMEDDREACRRYAECVDRIVARWPNDRDMQFERVQAWNSVIFATKDDRAACRLGAERVERIALPWPADPEVQRHRAQAWRCVVFATKDDPEACLRHAKRIDEIAEPWPSNRNLQFERAQAWRFVASSARAEQAACQGFIAIVAAIASRFPGDAEIEEELRVAERFLAG